MHLPNGMGWLMLINAWMHITVRLLIRRDTFFCTDQALHVHVINYKSCNGHIYNFSSVSECPKRTIDVDVPEHSLDQVLAGVI